MLVATRRASAYNRGMSTAFARSSAALRARVALALAALLFASCSPASEHDARSVVRVAVAANFARTASELEQRFELAEPHVDVELSVGSTGALYAQIVNGAPFDVLLAADRERPAKLVEEGRASLAQPYAVGRLALVGAELAGVQASTREEFAALLRAPHVRNVALANPDTAPYGVAALEVLDTLGLRAELEPRLARGLDVGQAHQFAVSGAAEFAFVALSQALAEPSLPHVAVPAAWHAPVAQDAALLTESAAARDFLDFLASTDARAVLEANGYALPDAP